MSELRLNTDGHIIKLGADNDVTLTHVADTGILLNSTMQLQFNDASQNINAPSATVLDINATDEIELNATLLDINANVEISGTATTTGVHTFSAAPVFPDGSIAVADLDIDGATDIGAAIVDADLFIIDDGAGGTNRKTTAARLKTYTTPTLFGAGVTDVLMDATNFTNSILIQTNSDGSAPTTGTLSSALANIGIGTDVFKTLTSGDYNVGIGNESMDALTTGSHNIAIGHDTLSGVVTGDDNICIGQSTGHGITSGTRNVIIGDLAYKNADTEGSNVAIGPDTITSAVNGGEQNTAVGDSALYSITSSDNCVAVGYNAGSAISSGSNNICIGKDAGVTGSPGGNITTSDNILVLGDDNIGASHIQTDFTVASDKRDKTDVDTIKMGLDFVNKLEPVTYRWDKRSKYSRDLNATPTGEHKENWLDTGFLAQDVEYLEKEYGYKIEDNTNLTTNLSKDGKQYGLTYAKFIPILTKAIQELSEEVKELKTKLEAK